MRYLILLFILSLCLNSQAQIPFVKEKRDYIWLMGYDSGSTSPFFGGTRLDFNSSSLLVSSEYHELNLDITNASVCDTSGDLLFYTNGIEIHNALHQMMENGNGLNPDPYTEQWVNIGYNLYQGALILPIPESSDLYYLFHTERTTFPDGLNGNL